MNTLFLIKFVRVEVTNMQNFKKLLATTPTDMVFTTAWLEAQGVDRRRVATLCKAGWLTPLGHGAHTKAGRTPQLSAALAALQQQNKMPVHAGGRSALARYHGITQYAREEPLEFFVQSRDRLPAWFRTGFNGQYVARPGLFLPTAAGLETRRVDEFNIEISTPERCVLEMLDQVPRACAAQEALETLELLPNLRPRLLRELLRSCKSFKVRRLFVCLAARTGLAWNTALDLSDISLGHGVRRLEEGGHLDPATNLVVKLEGVTQ